MCILLGPWPLPLPLPLGFACRCRQLLTSPSSSPLSPVLIRYLPCRLLCLKSKSWGRFSGVVTPRSYFSCRLPSTSELYPHQHRPLLFLRRHLLLSFLDAVRTCIVSACPRLDRRTHRTTSPPVVFTSAIRPGRFPSSLVLSCLSPFQSLPLRPLPEDTGRKTVLLNLHWPNQRSKPNCRCHPRPPSRSTALASDASRIPSRSEEGTFPAHHS